MKKARMNISQFRVILFNLKIFGKSHFRNGFSIAERPAVGGVYLFISSE